MAERRVKVRLVMEATYTIDPEWDGYGVVELADAVEIDRKALFGEDGLDSQLAIDAIDLQPVEFSWEEVTDG